MRNINMEHRSSRQILEKRTAKRKMFNKIITTKTGKSYNSLLEMMEDKGYI